MTNQVLRVDEKDVPTMETKWFRVEFSKDDPKVHDQMYQFGTYVNDRKIFNKDNHHIEYFQKAVGITYERILKTNSVIYLNELKQLYKLVETERPENIIERTETVKMKEVLKSITENNSLAAVQQEGFPTFQPFTAEVFSYDDVEVIFKNSSYAIGFPVKEQLYSLVYRNMFDIKEAQKPTL